jgi:hypothetical protein
MAEKNYIGVRWISEIQKWKSQIRHKGITYNCGNYTSQKEAIIARDTKIIQHGLKIKLQYLKPVEKCQKQ